MRDDQEDGLRRPVKEEMTRDDMNILYFVRLKAMTALHWSSVYAYDGHLSDPVKAALHDFALGLDDLIKDTLNKVKEDE